jgi:hypothetical protein
MLTRPAAWFPAGRKMFIFEQIFSLKGCIVSNSFNHERATMQYYWILDVLGDLKEFANNNGLKALAEQLDDTTLIAAAEISQVTGSGPVGGAAMPSNVVTPFKRSSANENS